MPGTLLDSLLRKYPLAKRQTLKRMLEAGRVRINGKPAARLRQVLAPGDKIDIQEHPAPKHANPIRLPGIVFEDADLIVIDKPPGLLTSTVPREPRTTLQAQVRAYAAQNDPGARVGVIHRLDRDASGLLVFSKGDQAYRSLKSQFFHHTVTREYCVVVHGKPDPPQGRIRTMLVERADGTVHSTRQAAKGQIAITEYAVIRSRGKRSLVRVILRTGRKHQIRVHLAGRGTPVVGDKLYGPPDDAPRLMLAAVKLTIQHPRHHHAMTFALPVPRAFPIHGR